MLARNRANHAVMTALLILSAGFRPAITPPPPDVITTVAMVSEHHHRIIDYRNLIHQNLTPIHTSDDDGADLFQSSSIFKSPQWSSSASTLPSQLHPALIDFYSNDEPLSSPVTEFDGRKTLLSLVDIFSYDYSFFAPDLSKVRLPWSADPAFVPTIVVYGLALVLGILGNLFVVIALLSDRKRDSAAGSGGGATNSFLVSLAVADVAFLVVCLPYEIGGKLGEMWLAGRGLCKLATFVEMAAGVASVLNLVAVSIERYIVIVHPLKSRTWCSAGRTHKIIAVVWIASAVLSSPVIHVMETSTGLFYNNETHVIMVSCLDCNYVSNAGRIAFSWYQLIVVFLFPIVTIIYCYTFVITVLWLSTKRLARLTHAESCSSNAVTRPVNRNRNTFDSQMISTVGRPGRPGRRAESRFATTTATPIGGGTRGGRLGMSTAPGRDHSTDAVEARKQFQNQSPCGETQC